MSTVYDQEDPVIVRFWGVRGSIPTPGPLTAAYGGNTSCVELRMGGEIIVLDAGTGIRLLGAALAEEFASSEVLVSLLVSHTHWDHIQGLPFFGPAYRSQNRVRIFGYQEENCRLEQILTDQMESPHFPIPMHKMVADISVTEFSSKAFMLGEVSVCTQRLNHPGGATGYRLSWNGLVVVYLPDNEPVSYLELKSSPSVPAEPDLDPNQELIDFVRGADVAIMDGQYDAGEYPSHIGWGHGCVDDVVRIAVAGGVKQLFLFHHDPCHDDAWVEARTAKAAGLAKSLGSGLRVCAAREGEALALGSVLGESSQGAESA